MARGYVQRDIYLKGTLDDLVVPDIVRQTYKVSQGGSMVARRLHAKFKAGMCEMDVDDSDSDYVNDPSENESDDDGTDFEEEEEGWGGAGAGGGRSISTRSSFKGKGKGRTMSTAPSS